MAEPVYVPVSIPATIEQAQQVIRAAAAGSDVYAVSHLCHTGEGRRKVLLSLRALGVAPDVARRLGWATGFPDGREPPSPTRDVEPQQNAFVDEPVDPNATTVVLERECVTDPEPPTVAAPKSSAKPSRPR